MLKQILLVGIGGGIGSILRFLISQLTVREKVISFPVATFTVNIVGCLMIGLFLGCSFKHLAIDSNMKALLITGLCGGLTTFSAFSLENFQLYQSGNYTTLIIYVLASIIIGFAAVWIGITMTK